jgi:lysophospholipase L1-like esterase
MTMRAIALVFIVLTAPLGAQEPGPPPLSTELPPLPAIDGKLPTVFLVGDSTMKVGTAGQMGWGEVIGEYFDLTRINLVNYARGGRSSRTFQTEGLWERTLSAMRPGDYVLIQFGHNDGGELFETTRPRGSLPGVGKETREGTVALTKTFEVVHTFGWYLRQYVADARARGATPIVCSLVPRGRWADGKIVREDYAKWARQVAEASGAQFLDLNEIIARRYDALGPERVSALFADAGTHTTPEGAAFVASMVVSGLKSMGTPLAGFLSPKAASIR